MDNQHRQIKGYRDLTAREIELMNQLKAKAEEVHELLCQVEQEPGIDLRWLSIGKTDLQKGFMGTIRAVARPETF
jgi:hypothetical protein